MTSMFHILLYDPEAGRYEWLNAPGEDESGVKKEWIERAQQKGKVLEVVKTLYVVLNPTKDWFSIEEVCEYAGWGRTKVVDMMARGDLIGEKDRKGYVRIERRVVDQAIRGEKPDQLFSRRKAA